MTEFYTYAPPDLRRHALEYLGRSVRNLKRDLESEEAERLRFLWENRFEAVKEANIEEQEAELRAFGWWFATDKLGNDWLLDRLLELLRSGVGIDWGHEAMERLAAMSSDRPGETLEAARLMVELCEDAWEMHTWREHLRAILATTYALPDVEVRRAADELLDRLLEKGYEDMRKVRPPGDTSLGE